MDRLKKHGGFGWVDRFCHGWARWPVLGACIVMGAGGAVNEGFSGWSMFAPFALVIWVIARSGDLSSVAGVAKVARPRSGAWPWARRSAALAFFAAVAAVSSTQYQNPWIYPILRDGYATALTPVRIGSYAGARGAKPYFFLVSRAQGPGPAARAQGPGPAVDPGEGYSSQGDYAKGARFRVVGIYGDTGDLYQRVGLVLSDGRVEFMVTEDQWADMSPARAALAASSESQGLFGQKIKTSKTVQASWAQGLGKLMLWPVFPILAMSAWAPGPKP